MRGVFFVIAFGTWVFVYGVLAPTTEQTAHLTLDYIRSNPEYGIGQRILFDAHMRAILTGFGAAILAGGSACLMDRKRRPAKSFKPTQTIATPTRWQKLRCTGDAR
jgi:hypothetical protein